MHLLFIFPNRTLDQAMLEQAVVLPFSPRFASTVLVRISFGPSDDGDIEMYTHFTRVS